jgi:hypothetical protein
MPASDLSFSSDAGPAGALQDVVFFIIGDLHATGYN